MTEPASVTAMRQRVADARCGEHGRTAQERDERRYREDANAGQQQAKDQLGGGPTAWRPVPNQVGDETSRTTATPSTSRAISRSRRASREAGAPESGGP